MQVAVGLIVGVGAVKVTDVVGAVKVTDTLGEIDGVRDELNVIDGVGVVIAHS